MYLNHEILVQIDAAICGLKENNNNDNTFNEIIVLLSKYVSHSEDSLEDALFSNVMGFDKKRFVAISFLRILDYNKRVLNQSDTSLRIKVFKLFDEILKHDIYKKRNIIDKDQTFHKADKLYGLIKDIEDTVQNPFKAFTNLSGIDFFEKSFLQVYKNKINSSILEHFLPLHLIDGVKFAEVIKYIKLYKDAELSEKLTCYKKANTNLLKIINELNDYNTFYSKQLLGEGFYSIHKVLQEDLEKTPLIKPADLTIVPIEKKYPLFKDHIPLKIGMHIRNEGNGYAYNVILEVITHSDNITPKVEKQFIDQIELRQVQLELDFDTIEKSSEALIALRLSWENYDGTKQATEIYIDLKSQREDIPWDKLKYEEPYSPEAVETEEELVGRTEILNRLFASVKNNIGSAYIYGQKRVGKTSIVKTLKNKIKQHYNADFVVLYIEGGEYVDKDPEVTIRKLTKKICSLVKNSDLRLSGIALPDTFESFTSILDFLDIVFSKVDNLKILVILDEFDEISPELYKRTEIGNSFFLTMRAICNKPQIGFWLVGGERMSFMINCHGEQLNKFQSARVDYFDKENFWSDFKELVKKPTEKWIEFTDSSINKLHFYTSGNPFFTKIICKHLFNLMVQNRDNHVTDIETNLAIKNAIQGEGIQIFSHFWEDAIVEKGDREEEISMNRKKVLLAIANLLNQNKILKKNLIIDRAIAFDMQENIVINILRDYVERQILIVNNDTYQFKVEFFKEWLISKGVHKIITTLADAEVINERYFLEERAKITLLEIQQLIDKWKSPYKGSEITIDRVRLWLEQFGENTRQRAMFKMISNVTFYSDFIINTKLEEMYKYILKDHVWEIKEGKRKRADILVSYLDGPGKSGAEYAKLFADRNDIYSDNIVEPIRIADALESKDIKALIFIDDFAGTGKNVCDLLMQLAKSGYITSFKSVKIYIGIVCGFEKAKVAIESCIEENSLNAKVILIDILSNSDKCFSDSSKAFPDPTERLFAKGICYEHGTQLEGNFPFGYGDCQSLVVFSKTCPNNAIPVLWKKTSNWIPLFQRS